MKKEAPEVAKRRDLIEKAALSTIALREKALSFLFWIYGTAVIATIVIIYLQGFRLWGFQLDSSFMKWLGAATVGEVAGMVIIVLKALFGREYKEN